MNGCWWICRFLGIARCLSLYTYNICNIYIYIIYIVSDAFDRFDQTITGAQQVLKTSGFTLQFASEALRCDREARIRKCGRVWVDDLTDYVGLCFSWAERQVVLRAVQQESLWVGFVWWLVDVCVSGFLAVLSRAVLVLLVSIFGVGLC